MRIFSQRIATKRKPNTQTQSLRSADLMDALTPIIAIQLINGIKKGMIKINIDQEQIRMVRSRMNHRDAGVEELKQGFICT